MSIISSEVNIKDLSNGKDYTVMIHTDDLDFGFTAVKCDGVIKSCYTYLLGDDVNKSLDSHALKICNYLDNNDCPKEVLSFVTNL